MFSGHRVTDIVGQDPADGVTHLSDPVLEHFALDDSVRQGLVGGRLNDRQHNLFITLEILRHRFHGGAGVKAELPVCRAAADDDTATKLPVDDEDVPWCRDQNVAGAERLHAVISDARLSDDLVLVDAVGIEELLEQRQGRGDHLDRQVGGHHRTSLAVTGELDRVELLINAALDDRVQHRAFDRELARSLLRRRLLELVARQALHAPLDDRTAC